MKEWTWIAPVPNSDLKPSWNIEAKSTKKTHDQLSNMVISSKKLLITRYKVQ